jgi:hypothetical protein
MSKRLNNSPRASLIDFGARIDIAPAISPAGQTPSILIGKLISHSTMSWARSVQTMVFMFGMFFAALEILVSHRLIPAFDISHCSCAAREASIDHANVPVRMTRATTTAFIFNSPLNIGPSFTALRKPDISQRYSCVVIIFTPMRVCIIRCHPAVRLKMHRPHLNAVNFQLRLALD